MDGGCVSDVNYHWIVVGKAHALGVFVRKVIQVCSYQLFIVIVLIIITVEGLYLKEHLVWQVCCKSSNAGQFPPPPPPPPQPPPPLLMMMKYCLLSSDVIWHIRNKLWPMPKRGSVYFLRPRKPEGSLGRTAQDGHLDFHTAPELCPNPSFIYFIQCPTSTFRRLSTLVVHDGLFWCLHNPPNSYLDYRIFNVRMWSFCMRIHTGDLGL